MSLAPITFQARWTAQNIHLKEPSLADCSIIDVCCAALSNPSFFAKYMLAPTLNPWVSRVVLPSQAFDAASTHLARKRWEERWCDEIDVSSPWWMVKDAQDHRVAYTAIPLHLTTPDNIRVHGTFYQSKQLPLNAPTVIVFQGNAMRYKNVPGGAEQWLLNKGVQTGAPYHIAVFDYRGTGESEGRAFADRHLVLDGEAVRQCLVDELHIAPQNIRFYGKSLGGATAAMVRQLHSAPTPLVSVHSFNSLQDLVDHTPIIQIGIGQGIQCAILPEWLTHMIASVLAYLVKSVLLALLTLTDWKFTGVPMALQSAGGDVLVVDDPLDGLIGAGGAYLSVPENQRMRVRLRGVDVESDRVSLMHHNIEMQSYEDEAGRCAQERILHFLLRA